MTLPATPAKNTWWTAILAGMASYIDAAVLTGSGVAVSVIYANDMHLGTGLIGAVLACQQFSWAVGAMAGGRLGDRFGRRILLNLALIVFVIGAVVLGCATTTWVLFPGAVLLGLGIGADLPAALAFANESAPRNAKGRMVVLASLMWALGIASVQLFLSLDGDRGTPVARIIYFALAGIAVVVLLLRLGMPESEEWASASQATNVAGSAAIPFRQAVALIVKRPVLYMVLATGLFYATWNVGASINGKYQTYFWTTLAGGDVETISRIALAATPILLVANLLYMRLVDGKYRQLLVAIGAVLILIGWAPLTFTGASKTAIIFVVFAVGLGSCFAGEALYKVSAQELIPTLLRGTTQGVTMGFSRVVAAVLALVVPSVVTHHPEVVFVGIFVCAVVSIALALLWLPRLKRVDSSSAQAPVIATAPAADGVAG